MTSEPCFNAHVIDAEVHNSSSGTILASYIIRPVQGREQKRESFFSIISMQQVYGNHINLKWFRYYYALITDLGLLGDIEESSQNQIS